MVSWSTLCESELVCTAVCALLLDEFKDILGFADPENGEKIYIKLPWKDKIPKQSLPEEPKEGRQ